MSTGFAPFAAARPDVAGALFEGRVALIGGATADIGAAAALAFARAGAAAVAVHGRDPVRGAAVVEAIHACNAKVEAAFFAADAADSDACVRLAKAVRERFGPIHAYMHCINAQLSGGPFAEADPRRFGDHLNGSLLTLFNACHAVLPELAPGGALLTLTSDAGRVASRGQTLIGATRAGIMMFTRALALEISANGLRANCISPTFVRGTQAYERAAKNPNAKVRIDRITAKAKLGLPVPEDIAELALFLCSPLAARITGQVISVNGGSTAA